MAASKNNIELVKVLVDKYKCDVNLPNVEKDTPLMKAIESLSYETALYLAEKQMVNLRNKN